MVTTDEDTLVEGRSIDHRRCRACRRADGGKQFVTAFEMRAGSTRHGIPVDTGQEGRATDKPIEQGSLLSAAPLPLEAPLTKGLHTTSAGLRKVLGKERSSGSRH
jgi:hypothetical protein